VAATGQPGNPLHGVKLETIVTALSEHYGWESASRSIRCFTSEPSGVQPEVLGKTPARDKVESLYLFMLRDIRRNSPPVHNSPPSAPPTGTALTRTDIDVVHQDEHLLVPNVARLAVCARPVRTNRTPRARNHRTHRSPPGHGRPVVADGAQRGHAALLSAQLKPAPLTSSTSPWSMAVLAAPHTGLDAWQLIDLPIAVDWPRWPLRII
jgi:uncharacterized protein (DUF2132 family)